MKSIYIEKSGSEVLYQELLRKHILRYLITKDVDNIIVDDENNIGNIIGFDYGIKINKMDDKLAKNTANYIINVLDTGYIKIIKKQT